ncbi:HAD family hydrolase [Spiroplasma sabaudiense Ar-1343]|uniref:HAD family hydrolase n=1 Tax=Spiroplasma sabaudiense Ar-1343 TaxID=1276257 RepID=W6A8P8_9MOLU|nr:HAD-IIB family hydrolase [Spiroplasma sabaudiense]AHI53538.1 HAD family hydrolase [Spiroplasma sabaudiense Ar-1343]
MKDIKLLALDMDGTAYDPMGEVVPENREAILKLIKKDFPVVFITGRPVNAPKNKFIENNFVSKYSVMGAFNGACIYDLKTNKILDAKPISKEIVNQVFSLTKKDNFKNVIIWGYSTDFNEVIINNLASNASEIIKEQSFFEGKFVEFETLTAPYQLDCYKLLIFNFTSEFINELKKIGLETAPNILGTACEVTAANINKKYAIQFIEKTWNINAEEIMAMGDGTNDIPMMDYVGFPVSFNNCVSKIKHIAKAHVDLDWSQGAVAQAISKYILKDK